MFFCSQCWPLDQSLWSRLKDERFASRADIWLNSFVKYFMESKTFDCITHWCMIYLLIEHSFFWTVNIFDRIYFFHIWKNCVLLSIVWASYSWCDLSFGWYWLRQTFKCLICTNRILACSPIYRIPWSVQFLNFLICWTGILICECIGGLWPRLSCIWYDWTLPWVIPIDHLTFSNRRIHWIEQDLQISLSICKQIFAQLFFSSLDILAQPHCLCCQRDKQQE